MSSITRPSGLLEAPAALDLAVERLVELAQVREAGQLVGDRLALHGLVEVAFSIDTTAWPARYANSSLSSRENARAAARDRHHAHVLGAARRAERASTGSPARGRRPARADAACRGRCRGRVAGSSVPSSSAPTSAPHAKASRSAVSSARSAPRLLADLDSRERTACRAGARGRRRPRTRPPPVRTARSTMPWRSSPAANASPTRRIVSSSSRRLRSTSSIFASSCSDMLLNSRPSARTRRRPRPGPGGGSRPWRGAAPREELLDLALERADTNTDEASASSRNAAGSRRSAGGCRAIVHRERVAAVRRPRRSTGAPIGSSSALDAPAVLARRRPRSRSPLGRRQLDRRPRPCTVEASGRPARQTPPQPGEPLDSTHVRVRAW